MKKLTIAAALAAVAIAVTVPLTFAQTGGYGMGPGMMGGYGGNGQGPGMMGGYGGYGPGAGMMGGYGGYGTGPGMMYGYGANGAGALNLTDDQREKITKIQEALSTKHWELMGKMQEQQFKLRELLASGRADDAAIGKAYKNIEGLRQQMWASGADAQKQMDAVLTKEQRDQLQRGGRRD
jgi:Spy/CpxP family protein refolding chaperone